jgi:1,4-alpha-glucan branching enzyme
LERNVSLNTVVSNFSPALSSRRYFAERTSHHVDFFCDAPKAENVRLVGDFNGWDPAANSMRRMPDGRWMASLELHHGHHRYLFLVDGEPMLDPNATGIARDDHNNRVSLIATS